MFYFSALLAGQAFSMQQVLDLTMETLDTLDVVGEALSIFSSFLVQYLILIGIVLL